MAYCESGRVCWYPWFKVAFLLSSLLISFPAAAEFKTLSQREAADSFVFSRPNMNEFPATISLSPFVPAPNEYKRFEDMSKADRRVALSQVAIGLIGKTVDNDVGRAMLALTDPIADTGGGVSCKQRFSTASYRLRCRIKF